MPIVRIYTGSIFFEIPGGGDTHPVVQSTDLVKGAVDATKLAQIETDTNVPTGTAVVVQWPSVDLDLETVVVLAPVGARYIVEEADGTLSNEFSLGSLATGILKNTVAAGVGVLSKAVGGDLPLHTHTPDAIQLSQFELISRLGVGFGNARGVDLDDTLEFSGGGDLQRAALTGDVTAPAGSNAATIANDAVIYAKMQNVAADNRILGNVSGAGSIVAELTAAQVRTMINVADGADVVGPGSSTDHAIARFHLATGKVIQDSAVLMDDSGHITVPNGWLIKDANGNSLLQFILAASAVNYLALFNAATGSPAELKLQAIGSDSAIDISIIPKGTGAVSIIGPSDGGYTSYDLKVGDTVTPDYGMIQIGNASLGRTSYNVGAIDLDGTVIFRNIGGPVTSAIEFIFVEATGGTCRLALPTSAVGNATYNPRSMLIIGPAPADTDFVKVTYWQALGWFHNLLCDTSGSGADLGVQNDLEVEGKIWTDEIEESTPAAGLNLQPGAGGDVVLFGDTDVADAADGKSLYVHRRAVEGDNSLRLHIADDQTAKVVANTDIIIDPTNAGAHSSVSIENSDGTYKGGLKVEGCAGVGRKDHGTVSSSPLSINWLEGNLQTLTLGINLTINFGTAPLVPTTGMAVLYLKITQGASTAYTVDIAGVDGWGSQETYVMSTGLGDYDIITIYYDGTVYSATPFGQNFG